MPSEFRVSTVAPWLTNHWAVSTLSTVWSGVSPSSSVMLTFPPGVRFRCCQRCGRGKRDEQEARVTLGHQIFENFDVTVGSGGMPGSVISIKVNQRCHNQPKTALTWACMCMGQGCLVIRLDQKIRATHARNPRKSRDLAVRSVPSEKSNVRLIAQLEKKPATRPTLTRSRSPSPAATQMFFCWQTIVDGGRGC